MKNCLQKFMVVLIIFTGQLSVAQINLNYQEPPKAIKDLAEAPLAPTVFIDEKGEWMVMFSRDVFKSIAEVAQQEYRLAGLRINPKTTGQSRSTLYKGISVKNLKNGEEIEVAGLPNDPLLSNFSWSPDKSKFSFTNTVINGNELWILDVSVGTVKKLTGPVLNDVFFGNPYQWTQDSKSILCKVVDENRGNLISDDQIPTGPVIQENAGQKAPARTYQDLLQNQNDEANFKYFAKSKLARVDLEGNMNDFLGSDMYYGISYSPDGNHLMVTTIHTPFSYLMPYYRFPQKTVIYDKTGKLVKEIYDAPLVEELPKGFGAVRVGPRNFGWRSDKAATIYWVEAQDEGDPLKEAKIRDALYLVDAPFTSTPRKIAETKNRYSFTIWGNSNTAMVFDSWFKNRNRKVYKINPDTPAGSKIIFDYSTQDLYSLPGNFVTKTNQYGRNVLLTSKNGKSAYLLGEGQSPEGNRPFFDQYDLNSGSTTRLWRADGEGTYERIIEVLDVERGELITRIESKTDNPNFYLRNFKKADDPVKITNFPHPYEAFKQVKKELIHYKREDGVDLTGVMYLPPGYDKEKDGRLPMLLWAYPREFKDAKVAGQVKDSPHRFTNINSGSAIFWVMQGYAILDRADFPIIGEGDTEPNDTFVEQLVANGKAAIDEMDRRGIVDPQRVGVGGHSYGAFMTANLLAHSDLFAAGIARSGAYNRTLTPFGFQREERTFWEAPEIYFAMSPFMHAHKVNEPILLIHGIADNNSGTFPMQSERYYNALKGHGATVRLVMLPAESHGYRAKESIMHMLWEMDTWLEKYVKNKDKLGESKQKIEVNK